MKEFHLFPKLPAELQDRVWALSIPSADQPALYSAKLKLSQSHLPAVAVEEDSDDDEDSRSVQVRHRVRLHRSIPPNAGLGCPPPSNPGTTDRDRQLAAVAKLLRTCRRSAAVARRILRSLAPAQGIPLEDEHPKRSEWVPRGLFIDAEADLVVLQPGWQAPLRAVGGDGLRRLELPQTTPRHLGLVWRHSDRSFYNRAALEGLLMLWGTGLRSLYVIVEPHGVRPFTSPPMWRPGPLDPILPLRTRLRRILPGHPRIAVPELAEQRAPLDIDVPPLWPVNVPRLELDESDDESDEEPEEDFVFAPQFNEGHDDGSLGSRDDLPDGSGEDESYGDRDDGPNWEGFEDTSSDQLYDGSDRSSDLDYNEPLPVDYESLYAQAAAYYAAQTAAEATRAAALAAQPPPPPPRPRLRIDTDLGSIFRHPSGSQSSDHNHIAWWLLTGDGEDTISHERRTFRAGGREYYEVPMTDIWHDNMRSQVLMRALELLSEVWCKSRVLGLLSRERGDPVERESIRCRVMTWREVGNA